MIEFILRLAKAWTTNMYGIKANINYLKSNYLLWDTHEHLNHFMNLYIRPVYDRSTIIKTRLEMRKGKRLNELLFDNMRILQELFNEHKHPK